MNMRGRTNRPGLLAIIVLTAVGCVIVAIIASIPSSSATNSLSELRFVDKQAGSVSATANAVAFAPAQGVLGAPSSSLSNGITFDHATLNDPVRMVGEPDIAIDSKGGIYVSGPGGSTTQASWFWKSEDKGIQWHSVGVIPEAKSNGQNGGGDTEITIANNNDVFASDLQTLQCNSTLRSYDEGKTFLTSEGCLPETDRQWMGVYDPTSSATGRRIYLSANNLALGCYVLVSTDNGVTYEPPTLVGTGVLPGGPSCIGRLAVDPANGDIFVPTSSGVFRSTNGGVNWSHVGSNG